jgi:hypothetical protein
MPVLGVEDGGKKLRKERQSGYRKYNAVRLIASHIG